MSICISDLNQDVWSSMFLMVETYFVICEILMGPTHYEVSEEGT